ncbi:MAG TPA: site-2 protease family protein [Tepidisphaeraceae bacterium]|jgi:Zn-dependent protease|nr:site-2 protease family protein [Tepidisphaeraceae bacterium]
MPNDEGGWQPGGSPRRTAPLPEAPPPPGTPPPGPLQYQSRQEAGLASPPPSGSLRLFRVFGVTVFLHWSWLLIAAYEVQQRKDVYTSLLWTGIEVLSVLVIVLLHEMGHAMACLSVKGTVDRIVLSPLSAASLQPPPRPGPTLWTAAAGPLVNLALFPILYFAADAMQSQGRDLYELFTAMKYLDLLLLVFNLLPIYPLDGGQILRALLWFAAGPAWSLVVAGAVGMLGAAGVAVYALTLKSIWIAFIAVFAGVQSWKAIMLARTMLGAPAIARRGDATCPSCGKHPPLGALWSCGCGARFDTFEHDASCPRCGQSFATTRCVDCGQPAPISAWMPHRPVPVASLAPASPMRHPPLPPAYPRD